MDIDLDEYACRFREDAIVDAIERLTAAVERLTRRCGSWLVLLLVAALVMWTA